MASRGGDDRHPEWYRNLVVHPEVELTVGGRTRAMIARTAVGDERAELWRRVVGAYRGYEAYQRPHEPRDSRGRLRAAGALQPD